MIGGGLCRITCVRLEDEAETTFVAGYENNKIGKGQYTEAYSLFSICKSNSRAAAASLEPFGNWSARLEP
jgi:hypothetical protein